MNTYVSPRDERRIKGTSQIFSCFVLLMKLKSHNNSGYATLNFEAARGAADFDAAGNCGVRRQRCGNPDRNSLLGRFYHLPGRAGVHSAANVERQIGRDGSADPDHGRFYKAARSFRSRGAPAVAKGTYTDALITLDFSTAVIVYDDGSLDGVALRPVGANGKDLGVVSVQVNLDPKQSLAERSQAGGSDGVGF